MVNKALGWVSLAQGEVGKQTQVWTYFEFHWSIVLHINMWDFSSWSFKSFSWVLAYVDHKSKKQKNPSGFLEMKSILPARSNKELEVVFANWSPEFATTCLFSKSYSFKKKFKERISFSFSPYMPDFQGQQSASLSSTGVKGKMLMLVKAAIVEHRSSSERKKDIAICKWPAIIVDKKWGKPGILYTAGLLKISLLSKLDSLLIKNSLSVDAAWITPCLPVSLDGKASACSGGDPGSIPRLERFPGEGNGNPLQDSCLENSMDRGAWWATVHGVA